MKRFISMLLVIAMIFAFATMASAANFTDVATNHVNYEAIEVLNALDIINGYSEDTFGPADTLTRAQMCTMMVLAIYDEKDIYADKKNVFTDVSADHWARAYIDTAVRKGLMVGYTDGTFGPDESLTYGQAARVILTALGYGYLEWGNGVNMVAYQNGLYENMNFVSFDAECPRAHAAQMLYNAFDCPLYGQYFYQPKNFLNDVLGYQETTFEVPSGSEFGHQYLAFKPYSIYPVYPNYPGFGYPNYGYGFDNTIVTNVRLTNEAVIYPRGDGNSYSFSGYNFGFGFWDKTYEIDWSKVLMYNAQGQEITVDKAETFIANGNMIAIMNKNNEIIKVKVDGGTTYIPGTIPADVLNIVKNSPAFNSMTSTVTYFKIGKYEISNEFVWGTVSNIYPVNYWGMSKQYTVSINNWPYAQNYVIDITNNVMPTKGDTIIIYKDYVGNIAGYTIR